MVETQELEAFYCVVKHASFAKAAKELSLSTSGVSRIVSRLEDRLGVRLVQRTTRNLSLTEAGSVFYARSTFVLCRPSTRHRSHHELTPSLTMARLSAP